MHSTGIEIERKFRLHAAPPAEELAAREEDAWRVEQVYLSRGDDGLHRRVRRIEHADGSVELVLTHKGSIGNGTISRHEHEESLTQGEYEALLAEADPARRPIRKTRHVVPHGRQVLEIDVFDVPAGLVVAEVELEDEDEPVVLPDWIGAWYEVTRDIRFMNAALARPDAEVPPFPAQPEDDDRAWA
ncbi:MAG TPA: CYTH domain-containing protein [Candidatus Limnocylindrales bacterium]|nr:CYTH domain-containing protein [Candidatus Limnocylindrales bacterium]